MAKIQNKIREAHSFGGIFSIMEQFDFIVICNRLHFVARLVISVEIVRSPRVSTLGGSFEDVTTS